MKCKICTCLMYTLGELIILQNFYDFKCHTRVIMEAAQYTSILVDVTFSFCFVHSIVYILLIALQFSVCLFHFFSIF